MIRKTRIKGRGKERIKILQIRKRKGNGYIVEKKGTTSENVQKRRRRTIKRGQTSDDSTDKGYHIVDMLIARKGDLEVSGC